MLTVIARIKNCDPRRLLSFITPPVLATYKIKIELRVLTIPGRLSSDLQSIVIPIFPLCSAILYRHLLLSPSLARARTHPRSPSLSLIFFLNPRRFRPCRVEFESTAQNRGVTKASYVSRWHAAMEGCAPFLNPAMRAVRRRSARAASWNAFSDPLLAARCSCHPPTCVRPTTFGRRSD